LTVAIDVRRLEAGQVIDGFVLTEPLDPGGMANFWHVTKPGIDVPMVMKIPLLRRGEDPITIIGFEAEQMILSRLHGPHVPRYFAAGDFERPYIVMEFIDGRSVKSLLPNVPISATEVARIGIEVAFALDDLHRQSVLHLDLKPSNIILRPKGDAALIDFGLSHHTQLPDLIGEEIDGPVGTAPYVAPEQVLGDRFDPRSDIFALGVVMYFLLTGERPFGDPQRAAEWRHRLWRDPFPPCHWNKAAPPWLQEVILRCLEVNPNDRYATPAQLAFDLTNPDQIVLTERACRTRRDGALTVMMRRLAARRQPYKRRLRRPTDTPRAPIIAVAVDLSPAAEALGKALRQAVIRVLATEPAARLACVNVLKTARIGLDPMEDAQGRNPHLQRLVELKHWARPLPIDPDLITFHVLEAPDPAGALVEFSLNSRIDHIVMGARGSSPVRRFLGSISAQVVAQARCTVTVVRLPQPSDGTDSEPVSTYLTGTEAELGG
jgi:nucleotide-binding universal stress UspA family protein